MSDPRARLLGKTPQGGGYDAVASETKNEIAGEFVTIPIEVIPPSEAVQQSVVAAITAHHKLKQKDAKQAEKFLWKKFTTTVGNCLSSREAKKLSASTGGPRALLALMSTRRDWFSEDLTNAERLTIEAGSELFIYSALSVASIISAVGFEKEFDNFNEHFAKFSNIFSAAYVLGCQITALVYESDIEDKASANAGMFTLIGISLGLSIVATIQSVLKKREQEEKKSQESKPTSSCISSYVPNCISSCFSNVKQLVRSPFAEKLISSVTFGLATGNLLSMDGRALRFFSNKADNQTLATAILWTQIISTALAAGLHRRFSKTNYNYSEELGAISSLVFTLGTIAEAVDQDATIVPYLLGAKLGILTVEGTVKGTVAVINAYFHKDILPPSVAEQLVPVTEHTLEEDNENRAERTLSELLPLGRSKP